MAPTYEWTGLSRGQAMGVVTGRDPREHPWGLFTRDEAPAPMRGPGVFLWFGSRDESGAFLAEVVPHLLLDREQWEQFDPLQAATRDVVERVAADVLAPADAAAALSALWAGAARFEWWGELADLTHGDGPFAVTLRGAFRFGRGEEGEAPPAPGDMPAFLAFVGAYA